MCWLFILGGAFVLWAVFIVRFMHKLIFKQLKYTEKRDPNIEERFQPFERIDREKWNILEIYFGAVFLLPIRLLIILIGLSILIGTFNLIVGTKKTTNHQEYPPLKRFIIRLLNTSLARIILWCFGIYYIEQKHAQISDYDQDYPLSNNLRKDRAPIIVSNHLSFLDIIYHTFSEHNPSFLSKIEVINFPFFGPAACAFQCIFVDRSSRDDKNQIKLALLERAKLIKEGKQFGSIIIFPEGTTSNGKSLISFKKGAFESLLPIKIVCIQYPIRHLNITLDTLGQGTNMLLGLCQFQNHLKTIEFNTFYPEYLNLSQDNENDWIIYANKVKDIMLKAMPHLTNSESGFRDMKEYEKIIKDLAKQNKSSTSSSSSSSSENKKEQ